jgi:type IV secretion system protein VirB2
VTGVAVATTLFERPTAPVLPAASDWVTATLFGEIAVALCVLAVAFIGLLLMTGRLAVREGVRVILGCFVLLGAPVIAAGLYSAAGSAAGSSVAGTPVIHAEPAPPPLPPSTYDPYAGASLRKN